MRRLLTVSTVVLLTALALAIGCQTTEDPVTRGLATITADDLLADVTTLAAPDLSGRLAGDPGYEAAARWAAHRLDRLGLEPGGDDGTFLQRLPIEYNVVKGTPGLRLTLADGAGHDAELGREFVCRGFTGSGTVEAPVVFAGYGLSAPDRGYDDYAGLDVTGKVVLIFKRNPTWAPDSLGWSRESSTPRVRARTARDHGARAVLWFDLPRTNDWAPNRGPIGSVLHGPGEHVDDIPFLEIDRSVADPLLGADGAAARLLAASDSLRAPQSRELGSRAAISVEAHYDPARETCNVVAVLPGDDPDLKDESLVLGAHLDHVGRQSPDLYFPGANDNASGAAAVLHLAEAFARAGRAPRRSLVFVLFAGEESGLVGASHHAAHPVFAPEHTRAMFNFDCVACGDSIRIGSGKTSPDLWNLARRLDADDAALSVNATWGGGGADATPFHEAGIPCLYWVTTNGYAYLHVPGDTPETLNGPLYEDLVKLAFRTAWAVADAPADSITAAGE